MDPEVLGDLGELDTGLTVLDDTERVVAELLEVWLRRADIFHPNYLLGPVDATYPCSSPLFSAPASQSEHCHGAQAIIQMLISQTRGHHPDRLARALGWDLDRLGAAAEKAAGPLAAVGLVIHNASSGLLLRPAVDLSETQARLDALQDDDEGLAQGPARVLCASYMGKLSATADRQDHHFYLGRLHKLGVLVDDRASNGGRHDLFSDFSFCLDF